MKKRRSNEEKAQLVSLVLMIVLILASFYFSPLIGKQKAINRGEVNKTEYVCEERSNTPLGFFSTEVCEDRLKSDIYTRDIFAIGLLITIIVSLGTGGSVYLILNGIDKHNEKKQNSKRQKKEIRGKK